MQRACPHTIFLLFMRGIIKNDVDVSRIFFIILLDSTQTYHPDVPM